MKEKPIYLLLDNNLYILIKTAFKKERKGKGKGKERKTTKATTSHKVCQSCQYIRLYHAGNMRGLMLNAISALAQLYNEL